MEKAKCLLCDDHNAKSGLFIEDQKDPNVKDLHRGRKYDCPNCGSYAIGDHLHDYIETFLKNKPEEKKKLSDYVKNHQGEGPSYFHLKKELIEKVLEHSI